MQQHALREQLNELLQQKFDPDKDLDLLDKVSTLVTQAYDGASEEEIEEVNEKIRDAFGLSDDNNRLGTTTRTGTAEDNRSRPTFESLVPSGGFFHRYLDWTHEHESPASYHFGSAITVASAGFKRKPLIDWEARRTYPNLFVMLVGPAGGRKGSAIDRAMNLMQEPLDINILPNEGTHQGFAAALKRRYKETCGQSSDGLIPAPEFSVLISEDKNKRDLFKWMTDWYDSPDYWERGLRGEESYELHNIYVSNIGGSNLPWLKDLPTSAITGGFMPRYILINEPGKRHWKARPSFARSLEKELVQRLRFILPRIPDVITFDPAAGRYLDHWYEVELREIYERTPDERVRTWFDRKQAATLKLAVVWQLMDGADPDVLHREYIERARRVVDWADEGVSQVYGALGGSQEGEAPEAILRYVRRCGGSVTQRSIFRKFRSNYRRSKIVEALQTLRSSGELRSEAVPVQGLTWRIGG